MRKKRKKNIAQIIRSRYEYRRKQPNYKKRKRYRKELRRRGLIKEIEKFERDRNLQVIDWPAPTDFSFINNTDKVIDYIEQANNLTKKPYSVNLDISKIETITSETIAFLIASITDIRFNKSSVPIKGNAPDNLNLRKLFTESGFYDHVISKVKHKRSNQSFMHKESDYKVKTSVAANAALLPVGKTFSSEDDCEPLYNILIELMSNTHHHANEEYGKTKWWLYVNVDPLTNRTYVTFLDLGVGIFESMVVKGYFQKWFKGTRLLPHIEYADDLLEGKIQSRIEEDNEIRGKGLPQIVSYSKLNNFVKFYLITNDVKINLKTGEKVQLRNNFEGTLYYIEIHPIENGN